MPVVRCHRWPRASDAGLNAGRTQAPRRGRPEAPRRHAPRRFGHAPGSPPGAAALSRLPRSLRLVLLALLLAYAGYLLLGNLFLNTRLADAAFSRHPERFTLEWRRALTLYPGHVSAWDVVAAGQARRVRWQARSAHASGRIALLPLLRRELRMPVIESAATEFEAERVDTDIPARAGDGRGWIIALPAIHSAALASVRWNDFHLDGRGEARFGIVKQLRGGPMQIPSSRLSMQKATLTHDGERLLEDAALDASFAMDRHRAPDHPGRAKLALIEAALKLDARSTGIDASLGGDSQWTLVPSDARGRVTADLGFDHGALRRGGEMTLTLPVSLALDGGTRRSNELTLQARVDDAISLRAQLPPQPDSSARLDADLRLAQRDLALDDPRAMLAQTSGRIDLRWRFDSLDWLSDLLVKAPWLAFDGAGEVDADLRIESGQLAAGSRFEIPQVTLRADVLDDRIEGSAHASGRIEPGVGQAPPRAHVDFVLDRFSMRSSSTPADIIVEGRALRLGLQGSGDIAQFRDTLEARLRFEDARLPDLTHYNHYLPSGSVSFTAGHGRVAADLTLDAEGRVARGDLSLRARDAGMRFAGLQMGGDVAIASKLKLADLAERRFDLDGSTLAFSRMSYRDAAGTQRRDWWARVELPRAHAQWGRPLQIDGEARIVMKDVGFLLALFSQTRTWPRWITRIVDAGEADVRGRARLHGRTLVLDRLVADNRRFRVRARLRLEDAQAHGDLLLGWGVLNLGVGLAPEDRDYKLVNATQWYESRPDLLPRRSSEAPAR